MYKFFLKSIDKREIAMNKVTNIYAIYSDRHIFVIMLPIRLEIDKAEIFLISP